MHVKKEQVVSMNPGGTIHEPEDFERAYRSREWSFYRGLLAACIRHGAPGKILDLGAGLGLFVECCMRYGIECVGIEGSAWACRKAVERCGMKLICSDLRKDLPLPEEAFSVVVCNQVIEHVDARTAKHMLSESHRVLQPSGIILVNSPSYFNKKERREATHINLYTPARLRREVENAGFEIIAEPNGVRPVLGRNRLSLKAVEILAAITRIEFWSDSANCVARKAPVCG